MGAECTELSAPVKGIFRLLGEDLECTLTPFYFHPAILVPSRVDGVVA